MTGRAIVIASAKGGTGKSMITATLAARASKECRCAIIDLEPQASVTLWWTFRGKPDNPQLTPSVSVASVDISVEKQQFDIVFVDTPPCLLDHIEDAVSVADFVLIPVRVSIFDLAAIRAVVSFAQQHNKPFAFLLNGTDPKWLEGTQSAIRNLQRFGPVIPKTIRHRTIYASSLTSGKTGPEGKDAKEAKQAAAEIEAVWDWIKAALSGKTPAKKGKRS